MNGQWLGKYSGTSTGSILINMDELRSYYQGTAYLIDENKNLPSTVISLKTSDKNRSFDFITYHIAPINPHNGERDKWGNIKHLYNDNIKFSNQAKITGKWDEKELNLSWITDIGVEGSCILSASKSDTISEIDSLKRNWNEFKIDVSSLSGRSYIFRGQSQPWRLRSSFHRTGRADLERFLNEDIQDLHKHLSSRTRHIFNLDMPNENGAFFNMLQHHGYPTPLLDWTYSPYIAAFFAYSGMSIQEELNTDDSDRVRIIYFNKEQWMLDFPQLTNLIYLQPHLSIHNFMAIDNDRMIPQQALSTVTNIDDIESYIYTMQDVTHNKYLFAIDLPKSERYTALQDLAYMGITPGSMFPGLDGACAEMKMHNFYFSKRQEL